MTTTNKEPTNVSNTVGAGFVALGLGALLVILAGAYFLWAGVSTASGRIAATTSNDSSLLTAASVDLVVDGGDEVASTGLLLDASGLYPGLQIERCFEVTYWGSAGTVPVRLFGRPGGGDGLETFINTTVEVGSGDDPMCSDFQPVRAVFDDTLLDLWNRHGSFDAGISLMSRAADGDSTSVRVTAEVVNDNEAQGLTTAFWLTIEARP